MKYIHTSLILLLLSVGALHAQETYNLKHCLSVGLEQNYTIKIASNNKQVASNNLTIGNAGYLPSLDLNGRYNGTLNDVRQESSTGVVSEQNGVSNQLYNAGLDLSWNLFNGFSVQTTYKKLEELKQLGELGARMSIEDLVSSITVQYYNYIQQQIRLKNLDYAVDISRERVRIVQERYLLGSASRLDLQQARVDFNADSSRLMSQGQTLATTAVRLNELMAVENVNQPVRVADTTIDVNHALVETDLLSQMLAVNANLLAAERNKTISAMDYKLVQSRTYPYLRLGAGYGYTYSTYGSGQIDNSRTLGLSYGLTLGVNLFDGFNQRRELKNAKLNMANRELQQKDLELALKSDLAIIYSGYKNNLALLRMEKQNLLTAKDNLSIAMERYKLGNLSGIELREAQKGFLDAEERLLTIAYQTKLAEISLMQISGRVLEYL